MSSKDQYQAGDLAGAIAASIEHVRNKPGDVAERWFLCELLAFSGDFERVDKHLDLIAQQEVKTLPNVALFRQLLRADGARRQFYAEGRVPQLLAEPPTDVKLRLEAFVLTRAGDEAGAAALLERAEGERVPASGTHNGKPFEDFRDLDDQCASVFEVLTSTGKYYWIPTGAVRRIEFHPSKGARDLLWRPARMLVSGGPDGVVYLPALYPNTAASADVKVKLGRTTEWHEGAHLVKGVGQRMYLAGEDAIAIGDLGTIEFNERATA